MLLRPRKILKCFDHERRKKNLVSRIDLGIYPVDLRLITGSVGRCLDKDFKFRGLGEIERLKSIKKLFEQGGPLPLIELYKIKDEYFVLDGHHRISVAKEMGQIFIDAHVIEFLPPPDNQENLLYRKRFDFEYRTNIEGVILTRKDGYDRLIRQIKEHRNFLARITGEDFSFPQAARDWFSNIYRPLIERIRQEDLTSVFRDATAADIYLYLTEQLRLRNRKEGKYLNFDEAVAEVRTLVAETQVLFPKLGLKERIKKIILPCYYQKGCPYSPFQERLRERLI